MGREEDGNVPWILWNRFDMLLRHARILNRLSMDTVDRGSNNAAKLQSDGPGWRYGGAHITWVSCLSGDQVNLAQIVAFAGILWPCRKTRDGQSREDGEGSD